MITVILNKIHSHNVIDSVSIKIIFSNVVAVCDLNSFNCFFQFTVSKKMAACRFYQNALRASSKNSWKKMTRNKANGIKFQHK